MSRAARSGPRRRTRRAIVIVIVLAVIALGAMVAMTALYFASAQRASVIAATRRLQARALAWSGVQAVAAELWRQRDDLLQGGRPKLESESVVFEEGTPAAPGDRGVFRLLPIAGALTAAEAGKVDLNSAPVEMLTALGVTPVVAEEIIAARRRRPFASVAEATSMAAWSAQAGELRRGGKVSPGNVLTVFSFDPQVVGGAPSEGGGRAAAVGAGRINIARPWSAELAEALTEVLGSDGAEQLRAALAGGDQKARGDGGPAEPKPPPRTYAQVCEALLRAGASPGQVARVVDACRVEEGAFRTGLVDVLSASAPALAAVPGLDLAAAERIISAREGLDSEARAGLGWLLERKALTPAQFVAAVDRLACRSLQWRVLVEGGVERREQAAEGSTATTAAGGGPTRPLRGGVVLEAVIDVSGDQARIALLRDVTMLAAAEWLDARAGKIFDPVRDRAPRATPPPGGPPEGPPAPAPEVATLTDSPAAAPPRPPARPGGRVGRWTTGGGPNER